MKINFLQFTKNNSLRSQNTSANQNVYNGYNSSTNPLRMNVLTRDTISFTGVAAVAEKGIVDLTKIKSLADLPKNLSGKTVFLRVDHNVPFDKATGEISDSTRIIESLPTIIELIQRKAKVVIGTHIGDPLKPKDGKLKKAVLNDKNVQKLGELLEQKMGRTITIHKADEVVGDSVQQLKANMKEGEILYLQNLRIHPGEAGKNAVRNAEGLFEQVKISSEEKNNFAQALAEDIDIYVNDAFGAAHREHGSTALITKFVKGLKVAGMLMKKELSNGSNILDPKKPFVAVLGGSKVSDKITTIEALMDGGADKIAITGAMAHTFTLAKGGNVGNSLVEAAEQETALRIMSKAKEKGVELIIPVDEVAATSLDASSGKVVDAMNIPEGMMGLDIGPKTVTLIQNALKGAKTVFANGPSGVYENAEFAKGTNEIVKKIINIANENKANTIFGGGDIVAAVNKVLEKEAIKLPENAFLSTGGGASLELIETRGALPAVMVLDKTV